MRLEFYFIIHIQSKLIEIYHIFIKVQRKREIHHEGILIKFGIFNRELDGTREKHWNRTHFFECFGNTFTNIIGS